MGLPLFSVHDDPGPSFQRFLDTAGVALPPTRQLADSAHATTVVAVRCNEGVVLVGDRRATGSYIASRDVRKIEPADLFTAIAVSGSAAMGLEFIKMAQLSFEHYEKMTDALLSLEGKANYLSPLIQRNNLMTPFIVIPMLAGFDVSRERGRVFEYDGAGGCYERDDFVTIGSGTPFAESTLRLGFRDDLTIDETIDLAALAIYEAGDNDPSTGGPDFVRNIYPMIVTVTATGYRDLEPSHIEERFRAIDERRSALGGRAGGALR
jgi:proteasome beta subunit